MGEENINWNSLTCHSLLLFYVIDALCLLSSVTVSFSTCGWANCNWSANSNSSNDYMVTITNTAALRCVIA
jgi:hypothetical protein